MEERLMAKKDKRKKRQHKDPLAHAIELITICLDANADERRALKEVLRLHKQVSKLRERSMKDALKRLKEVPRETVAGPTM
jgi:hypothetical protein